MFVDDVPKLIILYVLWKVKYKEKTISEPGTGEETQSCKMHGSV